MHARLQARRPAAATSADHARARRRRARTGASAHRLRVGESPTSLVVVAGTLAWTDSTGAVWSMPATGGEPRQLSDQQHPDFAFHVFAAGDTVLATSRKDVLCVTLPDGPVTVADGDHVYTRSWGTPKTVLRIRKDGARPPEILADDLAMPSRIAIDAEATYVTSREDGRIVRFAKSALR